MKRRILAWALLICFVLLLLNLIVFRYYWQLSMVIYLVIVFAFLLTNGRFANTRGTDMQNSPEDEGDNIGSDPKKNNKIGKYLDDAVVLNNDDTTDDAADNSDIEKTNDGDDK